MKKNLALLMALSMLLSLCACSSSLATDEPVEKVTATAETEKEEGGKGNQFADGFVVENAIVNIIAKHGNEAAGPIFDYVKKTVESL